eukprot:g65476.t1
MNKIQESPLPLYVSMDLSIPNAQRMRSHPNRRYTSTNRRRAPFRKQRPVAFARLLGMTYPELDHLVQSYCCNKWKCYSWVDTRDVIKSRAKSCSVRLEELGVWLTPVRDYDFTKR